MPLPPAPSLRRPGLLLGVFLAVAGCGLLPAASGVHYPTDQSITALGARVRCQPSDTTCLATARAQLMELARNLEAPYDGPGVSDPAVPDVPGSLTVTYAGAPFPWGAADGSTGTATAIAVDLAPLLRESVAYAVIATPAGIRRYSLPLGSAYQLLEMLYATAPR